MKINPSLFYIFFLFIPSLIFGQYQPVLSAEKTVYNIQHEPLDALLHGKIRIQGDTIINQKAYLKTYVKVDEWQPGEKFVGFVREDVIAGKLWFLNQWFVKNLGSKRITHNYKAKSVYVWVAHT